MADTSITYNVFAKFHGDEGKMHKFGAAAAIVGAAVGALAIKFGKDSVSAAVEAEAAQTKLNDSFAKFKFPADISLDSLKKFNSELATKTRFDDDATASGQAVLAQFVDSGKKLKALTPLLQDYAAKTGQDLPTAAASMGKAFLGNTRALKTLGINYKTTGDKTQDMANITALMQEKVGGFAEKEGKTAAGQAAILSNQFGEVEESVGAKLIPALLKLATVLLGIISFIQDHSTAMKVAGVAVGVFGLALLGLITVVKIQILQTAIATEGTLAFGVAQKIAAIGTGIMTAATWALNAAIAVLTSPITLVVAAIALLAVGLVLAYKHSETFRNIVNGAFGAVADAGKAMWGALKSAFDFIVNAWLDVAGFIINGAAKMFGWVPGVGGKLKSAAEAFNTFADSVRAKLSGAFQIGANFVSGVAEGIRATTGLAVGAAGDMSNKVANMARQTLKISSPSQVGYEIGDFFAQGVGLGIKAGTDVVLKAVDGMMTAVKSKLSDLRQQATSLRIGAIGATTGALDVSGLGNVENGGVESQLAGFAAQAGAFSSALTVAASKGLNATLIAKVAALGPTAGLSSAQALAALTAGEVAAANRDLALTDKFAAKIGATVLQVSPLPEQIAREQAQVDILKDIRGDIKAQRPIHISVHGGDPDAVVAALRAYVKKNGLIRNVAT